jgi:hypothetical protein
MIEPLKEPAILKQREYQSSFDALNENNPASLWTKAVEFSQQAKKSNRKHELYRQKAKILSRLWRIGCLNISGAEITPSRDLLIYVRYGVWGLHCPFDRLDLDCRRAIASTVAELVLGKDYGAMATQKEVA